MYTIGTKELNDKPLLKKTVICGRCGYYHAVEYATEILKDGTEKPYTALAFYKCEGKTYLAGVGGKEI